MNQVWRRAQFAGGELLVLLALADWADDDGQCWPKIPAIAEKSRLSERQVYRVMAAFREAGILTAETGGGRGKSNVYHINPDKLSGFCVGRNPDTRVRVTSGKTLTPASRNPDMGDKSPRPPNRKNHQEPSIKTSTPLPPSQAREGSAERVMAGCGWVNRRLTPMIAEAITLASERGEAAGQAAERMIAMWAQMQQASANGYLRYPITPRKFIAEAHWRTDAMWPYDQGRLREMQQAAVGALH